MSSRRRRLADMQETNRSEGHGAATRKATLHIDTAEMWENLCRADELLEDCESLSEARTSSPSESGPPEEAPRR